MEQADEGTQLRVGDAGIAITGGLDNLQKSADKGAEDKFAVHMTLGSGMLASDALPFYEGASTWPGYDFGSYVAGESPALMPATITINLDELGADEELKTQSGTIEFDLVSTDEKTYHFKITVVLDRRLRVCVREGALRTRLREHRRGECDAHHANQRVYGAVHNHL